MAHKRRAKTGNVSAPGWVFTIAPGARAGHAAGARDGSWRAVQHLAIACLFILARKLEDWAGESFALFRFNSQHPQKKGHHLSLSGGRGQRSGLAPLDDETEDP